MFGSLVADKNIHSLTRIVFCRLLIRIRYCWQAGKHVRWLNVCAIFKIQDGAIRALKPSTAVLKPHVTHFSRFNCTQFGKIKQTWRIFGIVVWQTCIFLHCCGDICCFTCLYTLIWDVYLYRDINRVFLSSKVLPKFRCTYYLNIDGYQFRVYACNFAGVLLSAINDTWVKSILVWSIAMSPIAYACEAVTVKNIDNLFSLA